MFRLKDRRVFLILLQNHLALFTPERSTAGFFTDTGLASIDVHMIRLAYLLSVIGTIMGCTSDHDLLLPGYLLWNKDYPYYTYILPLNTVMLALHIPPSS